MSLAYTVAALASVISNDADFVIKETRGRQGFHAFNIELKALQTKGTRMGPVEKGRLLGQAFDALTAAGYPVEDRNGYPGRDNKFVTWPHLRIVEPGTGYGAQNQANNAALVAMQAQNAQMLALLTAVVAKDNPEIATQLAGGAVTTPAAGDTTPEPDGDDDGIVEVNAEDLVEVDGEDEDSTFGEEASP